MIKKNELEGSDSDDDEEMASSLLEKVKMPKSTNEEVGSDEADEGNSKTVGSGPQLYVRDDGTVDWEGALQDRAALRKFGGAVWARINGQTPDDLGDDDENFCFFSYS